tara:strand:- start:2341 stop:3984 length:1644 start_codon:yes stop_codon:yes gene_type:complete
MKKTILLWGTLAICSFSFAQTEVFINEIHYDNIGGDTNEGVEIAGPTGTNLTNWRLVYYNGVDGTESNTQLLAGIIPNEQNNRGLIWFTHATSIQNDMEGIALIDPLGKVIQFLSYEGSFTATNGLANGLTSVDIGVEESDTTTAVGESLQLTGSGTNYEDFTWVSPNSATQNTINNSQTFSIAPAIISSSYNVTGLNYEIGSGPSNEGSFAIGGSNLTNDIIINSPSNFEISETSGGSFSTSITLLYGAGTISPTTIYVRLKTGLTIGNYNENVTITSVGSIGKTVSLEGNVSPNIGAIIITEIMKDPTKVNDNFGEYFEVYNTTGADIDMNGWVISDAGGSTHTINLPVVVLSGGYAVFGINSNSATNGGLTVNYQYVSTFGLVNTSDEIILTTPAEMGSVIIDQVYYDDINFPNNIGESMELHLFKYDAISNNTGSNWGTAITTYGLGDLGTPGTNNDFGLSVVKNEIENFKMYPNPVSNGILNMSSNNNANKQVEIYTLNGQQVYSENLQFKEKINISNLNTGIYLVRIIEEGNISTRKLVIN